MLDIYGLDESLRAEGFARLAGIDEAGRGPVAGPVVAAAVVLEPGARIPRLRDSKKVPEKELETLFLNLLPHVADFGIGVTEVQEIERFNILRATKMAMEAAVRNLMERPDILLIDAVKLPEMGIRQISMVRGESASASIAAASVAAKFVRDRLMLGYHRLYPEYGFDRHKGYLTAEHAERVKELGPSPIHRRSFGGVLSRRLPF